MTVRPYTAKAPPAAARVARLEAALRAVRRAAAENARRGFLWSPAWERIVATVDRALGRNGP